MAATEKILFNIPKNIKDEFRATCDGLGMNMTNVLLSMIVKFNKEAKETPKK